MQTVRSDNTYYLALAKGERVVETLTTFASEAGINGGSFTAIGAVTDITCGHYDLAAREYRFTTYPELVEVVSATGNITQKADTPLIHLHAVFSRPGNDTFGGHVEEMVVGVTLEVTLQVSARPLTRQYDDATGLHVWNFSEN